MPSPFPGMDPYLEGKLLWHDVHQRLAGQISRQIAPRLSPRYVARLETRFVASTPDGQTVSVLYPDVDVTPARIRERATVTYKPSTDDVATITPPLILHVAEQIKLVTVEIRDVAQNRLVTSIEILSPVNKRGAGPEEYRDKRKKVLSSEAHLLEIDLLRQGTRALVLIGLPQSDYCVFLTRAGRRDLIETWPTSVRDPLPAVPLPLLPGDDDVVLDLGHALRAIYDEARYDLSIDYSQPPVPPLSENDTEWAQTLDV
ncbi:MAG: DUF4058 family protein [Chloroflexi bacterium]|nr:DUF4058 family protein [Chloroflexota bacterium]